MRGGDVNRRRWVLAAMTASLTLVFLDQTAVSVALPSIRHSLGGTPDQLGWVVNAFLLTLAALAAVGGRLGDVLGRPRVLVVGMAVFMLASVACGLAPSLGWLVAMRALQGIGGAAMMPVTTAIVAETFPEQEQGRAFGIYLGVASLFLSIGPIVGGALSQLASWRWIFLINLPVATAAIVVIRRHVRTRAPAPDKSRGPVDVLGGAILVIGLASLVLALMQGGQWGWTALPTAVLLAIAAASLVLLPVVELRCPSPLLPLQLFRDGEYLGAGIVVLCCRFVTVGAVVLSAVYLQDALGLQPLRAGLALLPATVPMLLVAPAGGMLTDRFGPRLSTIVGLLFVTASLVALGLTVPDGHYGWLVPGLVGFGLGVGLVTVATSTAGMQRAASADLGEAAGLLATARQVGATLGLAAMEAVFVAAGSGATTPSAISSGTEAALLAAACVSILALGAAVLLRSRRLVTVPAPVEA